MKTLGLILNGPTQTPEERTREIPVICPEHGEQICRQVALFAGFNDPVCPVCEAERAERLEQARKILSDQQARKTAQERVRVLVDRAGIPVRFTTKSLDDYCVSNPTEAENLQFCQIYAEHFPDFLALGAGMIFCGTSGTGKTHLACGIANVVLKKHERSALFIRASALFRRVKDTFSKDSKLTQSDVIGEFAEVDLLIIDEIGLSIGSDTEKQIIFDVINERYERLKSTILISNLTAQEVAAYLGDRCMDRMAENGRMLVFKGKSKRLESKLTLFTPKAKTEERKVV